MRTSIRLRLHHIIRLRGLLEKSHSQAWIVSAFIAISLHVGGNALNAVIIKHTISFSDVSVGARTLIRCTRPRLKSSKPSLQIGPYSRYSVRNKYLVLTSAC